MSVVSGGARAQTQACLSGSQAFNHYFVFDFSRFNLVVYTCPFEIFWNLLSYLWFCSLQFCTCFIQHTHIPTHFSHLFFSNLSVFLCLFFFKNVIFNTWLVHCHLSSCILVKSLLFKFLEVYFLSTLFLPDVTLKAIRENRVRKESLPWRHLQYNSLENGF